MNHNIYRHGGDFDKDVICDKLAGIEEQIKEIEDSEEEIPNREQRTRELMYAQLIQGLRLCTGYRYF